MRRVVGLPASLFFVDVAVLTAIPGVLAAIHFGVPAATELLAFYHGGVRVYALLTAAYVHGSDAHLFGNVAVYGLIVWFPYLLSVGTDGRRWFYRVTAVLLVVVPVVTSLTSYLVFGAADLDKVPVTLGFSPVIAGFVGLYFVSMLRLVADRHRPFLAGLLGVVLGIEMIQILAVRYEPLFTVGSAVVLIATVVVETRRDGWRARVLGDWNGLRRRAVVIDVLFVGLLVVTAGIFLLWLFPAPTALIQDAGRINLVGHATGLACGILSALVALRRDATAPVPVTRWPRSNA